MRKQNKKKNMAAVATLTALSVVCTSVSPATVLFAKDGVPSSKKVSVLADEDYVFEGNMIKNGSFDENADNWNGSSFGRATNNPGPSGGGHYWLDPGAWMGQKFKVPYTGWYKVSTWVSQGGSSCWFGCNNDTQGKNGGMTITSGSTYTRYEQKKWMHQGDQMDVWMGKANGWVNGDDFSVTYDTSRHPNLVVNPDFTSEIAWELGGKASIADGQAVLAGPADSISQSLYIPQYPKQEGQQGEQPYYAEVVLTGAEDAVVTFNGESKTVSGDETVRFEADLVGHDAREISVSGKANVKSVVLQYDLSKLPENKVPVASNVKIVGEETVDLGLEASYDYSDAEGHEDANTEFQWLIADSKDGEFAPIEGATTNRITVKKEWEDKYIKLAVTPIDELEGIGETVTSEAVGPVNVNLIQDPGFEQNGKGWKGMSLSNKDAYEGLVRGIVNQTSEASQEIVVEKDGYYDLSAFVRYAGEAQDGILTLEDAGGAVLAEIPVGTTDGYEAIQSTDKIALEHDQKIIVRFKGASDASYDVDRVYLMRDREAGIPPFNSIIGFTTSPKAFKTVIDRANKEVNLTYLYGTDISKVTVNTLGVSEGASATVKPGDVLNLTKDVKLVVTGKDGEKAEWTIKSDFTEKKVQMSSSNEYLTDTFNWAAYKMDQFVMTGKQGVINKDENNKTGDKDENGNLIIKDYIPSYWAGYYDRTAFYSRDFVHQATGGQIAGLEEENYTMFNTFAKGCTESRGWYTPWAFNFDGTPHTIDFKSDTNFVREVPAQFELVEKAYKQYLWSGDRRYVEDEDMFNFYTNVMTKYVETHDTNGNGIAEGTGGGIFQGTASYNERGGEPLLEAGDALGSQYQATLAYAGILKARGDEAGAAEWYQKAADLKKYFNDEWSVVEGDANTYARGWSTDGTTRYTGFGKENSWFMPMKLITEPGERNDAYIDFVIKNLGNGIGSPGAPTNLEAYTYIPDMLFPYNRNDEAWKWMKYITSVKDNPHERPSQGTNGDYPEISFTFVSHVVEGMMGVEPNAGEGTVATSPRLPGEVPDATVKYMDIGDYELDLTHTGNTASDLTNHADKEITWEARFYGNHEFIKVGDKVLTAETKDINGETVSYVTTKVASNETVHVEVTEEAPVENPVEKDELQKVYDEATALEKGNYTDSSWKKLNKYVADAKVILEDEKASQKDVDKVLDHLNKAVKGLKENNKNKNKNNKK